MSFSKTQARNEIFPMFEFYLAHFEIPVLLFVDTTLGCLVRRLCAYRVHRRRNFQKSTSRRAYLSRLQKISSCSWKNQRDSSIWKQGKIGWEFWRTELLLLRKSSSRWRILTFYNNWLDKCIRTNRAGFVFSNFPNRQIFLVYF